MIIDTSANAKSKAEKRLAKLKRLTAKTEHIVVRLTDVFVADRPAQLKAITAALKAVDDLRSEGVNGTGKIIDSCMNELTSLREGIFLGLTKKKDLNLVTCSAAIQQFKELTITAEQRLERVIAEEAADAGHEITAESDPTELVIQRNMKEAKKLPSLQDKLYAVGRAPVVVVTHSEKVSRKGNPAAFVDRSKLERMGFEVESLDGYAIIHNQLVLGVNTTLVRNHLEQANEELRKATSQKQRVLRKEERDLRKKRGVEDDEDDADNKQPALTLKKPEKLTVRYVADQLRQSLIRASKKRYVFVLEVGHAYGLGTWFWLMTEPEMNAFAQAFPGGRVQLNEFGFAF